MNHTFTVEGMHCNSCKVLIQEALEDEGAVHVHVDLDEKRNVGIVKLTSDMTGVQLKKIIEEQGDYRVK